MIGSVNFDGTLSGSINAGGGGGGSTVVITPVVTEGTKIADVTVDGAKKDLYIPDYGADITALNVRLDTAEGNITNLAGRTTEAETDISEIKQSLSDLTTLEKTASGEVVTFDDGIVLPLPALKVFIEPLQSGSGDPSPDNIRPISGWDNVNVTVADDVDNPTVENVYTIDLDGTCYGGTLDVVSGVLTVKKAYVNMGTLAWSTAGSGRHNTTITGANPSADAVITNAVCSNYVPTSYSQIANIDNSFFLGYQNTPLLQVNDSEYNGESATDFKAHMNGVQLVYELATPQTIQLTPTQVNSLIGVNNIYADTGDVELTYFVNNSLVQTIYDMVNVLMG